MGPYCVLVKMRVVGEGCLLEAFIEGHANLPFGIRLALALPIAERIMLASRRQVFAPGVD